MKTNEPEMTRFLSAGKAIDVAVLLILVLGTFSWVGYSIPLGWLRISKHFAPSQNAACPFSLLYFNPIRVGFPLNFYSNYPDDSWLVVSSPLQYDVAPCKQSGFL